MKNHKTSKGKKAQKDELIQSCGLPKSVERILPNDIDPGRESLIRIIGKTWVNGTQIHYCFWDSSRDDSPKSWDGTTRDKNVVIKAWKEWKELGTGLEFIEVEDPSDAEVRIGFQRGGSWSYLGTDVLSRPTNERTMNFGWQLYGRDYGRATALHEIGHTLGLPHEHQNPKAGIKWNEDNVYNEFSGPPNNWSEDKIYWNILRKIPVDDVDGSDWDPLSIMHYSFKPQMIDAPTPWSNKGIDVNVLLSEKDKSFIQNFYPTIEKEDYILLKPFKSIHAKMVAGDQLDFIIKPKRARKYNIQTLGRVDTLLTLFEKRGEENSFLEADDDAGFGRNASITYKLFKDREYILRLRYYYGSDSGDTMVIMF